MTEEREAPPVLLVVDDEAVLGQYGARLDAGGTLVKAITRSTLAPCLGQFTPARS